VYSIQRRLSACRNEIKGFAILWIVFFHAQLGLSGIPYEIQKIGYGGVDLFLFLFGFGLYRSLEKNSDPGKYLKRRAMRLLPAYVPFCLLWLAVMLPMYGGGIATSLRIAAGNLTMLGFFANAPLMINWYVSALAVMILLAPFFYSCIQPGKHGLLRAAALMAALFLLGFAFIGTDQYMAVSRLPVFLLGMIFASPCEKTQTKPWLKWLMPCAFAAGVAALYLCFARWPELLNDYAMYWHPFVLIAPPLCAGLAWLFERCPSKLAAPLRLLGEASFEIFLFNVWIEVLGKKFGLCSTPLQWAAWSAASVLAGIGYHFAVRKIVKKTVDNHP